MKPLANYLLKTAAVTAIAFGMSMAFASSASADETLTDVTFEDQVDPAYVEYLLELGSALATDTLTPEEENLREEAERAALDAALEGFDERLAILTDEVFNSEFDGGVKSWRKGIIYYSTTQAGFEYLSNKYKSMIDDGYLVLDATFDMRWPTDAEVEAAYWAARSAEAAAIEEDEEVSNSEPTEPILEDEQEISYPAIEPALTSQAEESTVTWFAYGPEGTENGIDWSRLYYQFALLSMLTLPQPGSSLGVTSGLLGSGQ